MSDAKRILVGVDIEKAGKNLIRHPVVSVAFAVCNDNAELLTAERFNFNVNWALQSNGGDFEDTCWHEFWSKLPTEVVEACKVNTMAQDHGWRAVAAWLNELEMTYPTPEYKIIFINDNPSFDIANIDYNLEHYANRHPMRYTSNGEYRTIVTIDDAFYMMPESVINRVNVKIKKVVTHNHNPVNDAHFMCQQFYWFRNEIHYAEF